MKAIEHVIYWRDPQIQDLEICQVSASGHVFPDHAHDGIYAVGMMISGGAYCLGPEKSYSLVSPGQIALINPSQMHSGVPAIGKQSYRMIYFNMDLMAAAAAEVAKRPHAIPEFACMVIGDPLLWRRLQRLCGVISSAADQLEKESVVMDAMVHLVAHYGNIDPVRGPTCRVGKAIEHAQEYLSADLDCKITLEEAARTAGLSRYHFLRVFKRETGFPPPSVPDAASHRPGSAIAAQRPGAGPGRFVGGVFRPKSLQQYLSKVHRGHTGTVPGPIFPCTGPGTRQRITPQKQYPPIFSNRYWLRSFQRSSLNNLQRIVENL